jgi:DNA-binding transcriptional ArsR family regulator
MPPERRQLVIDLATAATVHAQVGPTGWLVLEAIASHTSGDGPVVEVACSTRSLAEVVGVSKDSVARALRCLTAVGIVERVDHRDDRSGRFSSTSYLVDLAAAGITVRAVSDTTASAPTARASSRNRRAPYCDQLSLLT